MTPATFLLCFPEFERTSPNVIKGKMLLAATQMGGPDFSVWPAFALVNVDTGQPIQPLSLGDLAHGLYTAHLLQSTPFGAATRLEPAGTDGRSVYSDQYEDICRTVALGPVVAGIGLGVGSVNQTSGPVVLQPGAGWVSVVNGSANITFELPQSFGPGTLFAFVGAQPGAIYVLQLAMVTSTGGALTAPFTGPTTAESAWNYGYLGSGG